MWPSTPLRLTTILNVPRQPERSRRPFASAILPDLLTNRKLFLYPVTVEDKFVPFSFNYHERVLSQRYISCTLSIPCAF